VTKEVNTQTSNLYSAEINTWNTAHYCARAHTKPSKIMSVKENKTFFRRWQQGVSLGDSYQIFIICRQLHVRSGVKIWTDSVKVFWSFASLSLGVCTLPQMFSAPKWTNYASEMNMFGSYKQGTDLVYNHANFGGARI